MWGTVQRFFGLQAARPGFGTLPPAYVGEVTPPPARSRRAITADLAKAEKELVHLRSQHTQMGTFVDEEQQEELDLDIFDVENRIRQLQQELNNAAA